MPARPDPRVGRGLYAAAADLGDHVLVLPQHRVIVFADERETALGLRRPAEDLAVEPGRVIGVAGAQLQPGRALPRPTVQSERTAPSQMPNAAPSGSVASAARPEWKASGPTATVAPRSLIRAAASSTSATAKYGVQETAT